MPDTLPEGFGVRPSTAPAAGHVQHGAAPPNGDDDDGSVRVVVRVRPFLANESAQGARECVFVQKDGRRVDVGTRAFTFDRVFAQDSQQVAVFEDSVLPLVESAFAGYNATILAYGQTGSGKTFTMGSCNSTGLREEELGILPRVIEEVYRRMDAAKNECDFTVRASFIEIYNEDLRDLLDRDPNKSLIIREDPAGGICVVGAKEIEVQSYEELLGLLEKGSVSRTTGSTLMNAASSRSHAIFSLSMEQSRLIAEVTPGDTDAEPQQILADGSVHSEVVGGERMRSKFHFVDLAGSERLKKTQSSGTRMKEGININQGLLALGNVISALGDEKKRAAGVHVPYRDAKLTRLLQDSLGGNSRTLMFACVSPADVNFEETLNTLKYANRARNIKNKPVVNRDVNTNLLHQLRAQIAHLERELAEYRAGGVPTMSPTLHPFKSHNAAVAFDEQPVGRMSLGSGISGHMGGALGHGAEEALRVGLETEVAILRLEMSDAQQALAKFVGNKENANSSTPGTEQLEAVSSLERRLRDVLAGKLTSSGSGADGHTTPPEGGDTSILSCPATPLGPNGEIDPAAEAEWAAGQRQLRGELDDLDSGIVQKERLLQELLQSRQQYEVLSQSLEVKIQELEKRGQRLHTEKEQVQRELTTLTTKTASSGSARDAESVSKYTAKLKSLESELASLKRKQREHERLRKINEKNDERIAALQGEMDSMKSGKTQLLRKMREETKTHREKTRSQDVKIAGLQREVTKDHKRINDLQHRAKAQEAVLARREEQLALYQRRLKSSEESFLSLARTKAKSGSGALSKRAAQAPSRRAASAGRDRSSSNKQSTASDDRGMSNGEGWVMEFVQQRLARQHAAAALERERAHRARLLSELTVCVGLKTAMASGDAAVVAKAVATAESEGANFSDDVDRMDGPELDDHIEYLNAEIEFKDMTIKEAAETLSRPLIDVKGKLSTLGANDAREAVAGLAEELVRRGEVMAKQADASDELTTLRREIEVQSGQADARVRALKAEFDTRATAMEREYEDKVLFLLEQLQAKEAEAERDGAGTSGNPTPRTPTATPRSTGASSAAGGDNGDRLPNDLQTEHISILTKQNEMLVTEAESVQKRLEALETELRDKSEKQTEMAKALEEQRRRAESARTEADEAKRIMAMMGEASASSNHSGGSGATASGSTIPDAILHGLHSVWDDMGIPAAERRVKVDQILNGVTAIGKHTLEEEQQRRDSLRKELQATIFLGKQLCKQLGQEPTGALNDDAVKGSGGSTALSSRLTAAKVALTQLEVQRDALRAELQEKHSRLQLAVAELGGDTPAFARDLVEWREEEIGPNLHQKYDDALQMVKSNKVERLAGVGAYVRSIRSLWEQLGAEPDAVDCDSIDRAVKRGGEGLTLGTNAVAALEAKKARLTELLGQRRAALESLELTLRCHWAALDVPVQQQEAFQQNNPGYSKEALGAREAEIRSLQGLLSSRLQETKNAVQALWVELKVSDTLRQAFWSNVQDEVSLETLCALQIEKAKLETKKQSLRVILSLISKRDAMLDRMREFEERATDPNRLFKGSSADRLEEERFRLKVAREYPRIQDSLKSQISVWEQAYGESFSDGMVGLKDSLSDPVLAKLHEKLLTAPPPTPSVGGSVGVSAPTSATPGGTNNQAEGSVRTSKTMRMRPETTPRRGAPVGSLAAGAAVSARRSSLDDRSAT